MRISKLLTHFTILITISVFSVNTFADEVNDELGWPKKIEGEKGTVIIYQPQTEVFTGDKLEARAAISVTTPEQTSPTFGAMWFECRVSTDRDERTVALLDVKVIAAKFPEIGEENVNLLIDFVETEIPKWELVLSLDRLLASLNADESGMIVQENFNNTPPEIIFKTSPSVLIMIDGDPILKDTDKEGYQYVVNTPFLFVKETKKGIYYLKGGNYWYSSNDPITGWKNIESPPKKVEQLAAENMTEPDDDENANGEKEESQEEKIIPELVVRTKPAELLQSAGEPEFEPVQETFTFMKNSDDDILMNINTQEYFV
ncbi:MAG: hypothetical protein R2764_16715 [Bacteroidales bacterium]